MPAISLEDIIYATIMVDDYSRFKVAKLLMYYTTFSFTVSMFVLIFIHVFKTLRILPGNIIKNSTGKYLNYTAKM